MQQLLALTLVCVILFVRIASISFWKDTDFSRCLGYTGNNNTEAIEKEALAFVDYSLKHQLIQVISGPMESIAESAVELFGFWECIKETNSNITKLFITASDGDHH